MDHAAHRYSFYTAIRKGSFNVIRNSRPVYPPAPLNTYFLSGLSIFTCACTAEHCRLLILNKKLQIARKDHRHSCFSLFPDSPTAWNVCRYYIVFLLSSAFWYSYNTPPIPDPCWNTNISCIFPANSVSCYTNRVYVCLYYNCIRCIRCMCYMCYIANVHVYLVQTGYVVL